MGARKIFLVRHAETLLPDDKKRFIGKTDLELSPKGIEQARRLGEWFRGESIQEIYTSPLGRAVQTAEGIGAIHGIKPVVIPGLAEINLGEWEGRSFEEVRQNFSAEFEERGRNIGGYRVPGGESFCDLQQRGIEAFYDILGSSQGDILLVGHKGINRVLLCQLLGMKLGDLMSIPQEYGCINMLEEADGEIKVLKMNEVIE